MERGKGETFAQYKARRKLQQGNIKRHRRGKWFFISKTLKGSQTFTREGLMKSKEAEKAQSNG